MNLSENLTQPRESIFILKAGQRIKSFTFRCNLGEKLHVKPAKCSTTFLYLYMATE